MEENHSSKTSLSSELSFKENNSKSSLEKFQEMAVLHQQKKVDAQNKLDEASNMQATPSVETDIKMVLDASDDKYNVEIEEVAVNSVSLEKEIEKEWKDFKRLKEHTRILINKKRKELLHKVFFTYLGEE